MDGKKVLDVIGVYRSYFEKIGAPKIDSSHDELMNPRRPYNELAHCHGMLDKMEKFVAEGRMDKAFRWLGFIQGCLWATGHYNLEELKNHSRPNTAD